jgi:hypothetical protein
MEVSNAVGAMSLPFRRPELEEEEELEEDIFFEFPGITHPFN